MNLTHFAPRFTLLFFVAISFFTSTQFASAAIISGSSATADNTKNGANTLVINIPASTQGGDFLMADITVDNGTDTGINTPSGWTLIRRAN